MKQTIVKTMAVLMVFFTLTFIGCKVENKEVVVNDSTKVDSLAIPTIDTVAVDTVVKSDTTKVK